jgi:hypothetical protein
VVDPSGTKCQGGTGASVAQVPEPRPKVSSRYRSHGVKHEPGPHTYAYDLLGVSVAPTGLTIVAGSRNMPSGLGFQSGCRDLNPGPLDPQSSALTKLRHSP